jgi:homogentisate 1,2-dioxygenase
MLHRIACGDIPQKAHTALRGSEGQLRYEECFTRAGFDGPYTILYHERRPHEAEPTEVRHGWEITGSRAPRSFARRHLRSFDLAPGGGAPLDVRVPLCENDDLCIATSAPDSEDPAYFVNADADDLYFIREGRGTLRSQLGELRFEANDYVYVPKGMLHRFVLEGGAAQRWLVLECRAGIGIPEQYRNGIGQLRMDAPYSHRDFRAPEFSGPVDEGIRNLVVKRGQAFFGFRFVSSPLDVVGWDGTMYPWAFSILDFAPRVGLVHLPPTVHATFVTRGALICSFVPRPLDFHPDAVRCPYPHSSVDIDELIYYVRGNFTSRRGVAAGSISIHPAGIPHGPHPGAYEASLSATHTDELAVMLDCSSPLRFTAAALRIDDVAYHHSFVDPGGNHSTG